ncbi:MAG: DUF177 domain-containing protein [Sphingomonadaceae bacterium]|nr:DUF177 domain-containing protein [Sphingomonadaceae bacterium]
MSAAAEFSRLVRLDELGAAPRRLALVASEAERAALAARFGLPAIASLAADVALTRSGAAVALNGDLRADVTQSCVATGVPIDTHVEEPLVLRFEPEAASGDEVELDQQALDVLGYEGNAIDVGEAVAQSLLLALDPFPRCASADAALREAGVLGEEEAEAANVSPLAAALKAKFK